MKDTLEAVDVKFLRFYVQYHIDELLENVNDAYEPDGGGSLREYVKGQLDALIELKTFLEMQSSGNYTILQEKYQDSLTPCKEDT